MPTFSVMFKGAVFISRTLMGPYRVERDVHSMKFTDCENGLGIKVIGGVKEQTGEEFGVYIKRILPGGLASNDGNLMPGDQILEVNGESLVGVTRGRAVDILRTASATNYMRLLIARNQEAKKEFAELLEKYGSTRSTRSTRTTHHPPVQQGSSSEILQTDAQPKITLDPCTRLKSDKLHLALTFLGLDVTEEKRTKLRQNLTTDPQGTVAYADFVETTWSLFRENLEQLGRGLGPFLFSYHEAACLVDTSAFHSPSHEHDCNYSSEKMNQFGEEVKQLQTQMEKMTETCLTVEENSCVTSCSEAVEVSVEHGQLSSAEQDYEEVIQLLEAEIRDLKNQLTNKGPNQNQCNYD